MKNCLLSLVITFLSGGGMLAQNMVPNPSFEEYFSTFCGIMQPSDFNLTMMDWRNPTFASPSVYFTSINDTCYNYQPDSQYSGPIGIKGTQLPRTGEVMAGIWVYTIDGLNQRQYLQIQLETPMTTGKAYIVSFYVSLADFIESSINNLGAHLSEVPISESNDGPLDYEPQILESNFITDITNWTLVSDTIVADAGFKYLTIGNFYEDDSTSTQPNPTSSGEPGTYGAFYFVDDVSVVETILTSTRELDKMDVEIFPNPIKNEINISFPENESDVSIRIFNAQGLEIYDADISGQNTFKINSSNFPKGANFIHLKSKKGFITEKMVKF